MRTKDFFLSLSPPPRVFFPAAACVCACVCARVQCGAEARGGAVLWAQVQQHNQMVTIFSSSGYCGANNEARRRPPPPAALPPPDTASSAAAESDHGETRLRTLDTSCCLLFNSINNLVVCCSTQQTRESTKKRLNNERDGARPPPLPGELGGAHRAGRAHGQACCILACEGKIRFIRLEHSLQPTLESLASKARAPPLLRFPLPRVLREPDPPPHIPRIQSPRPGPGTRNGRGEGFQRQRLPLNGSNGSASR